MARISITWPTSSGHALAGYQDLSDHDIRAIYEYLRAIPPQLPVRNRQLPDTPRPHPALKPKVGCFKLLLF